MSTPKKPATKSVKPSEPKPKYNIGQKGWAFTYHRGKPEEILEVKIESIHMLKFERADAIGKKAEAYVDYSYTVKVHNPLAFPYNQLGENSIYPSFQSAANIFAQAFTTLLK